MGNAHCKLNEIKKRAESPECKSAGKRPVKYPKSNFQYQIMNIQYRIMNIEIRNIKIRNEEIVGVRTGRDCSGSLPRQATVTAGRQRRPEEARCRALPEPEPERQL